MLTPKLPAEMAAEFQATKYVLEKACRDGPTERHSLITQGGPNKRFEVLVIHILLLGQRMWDRGGNQSQGWERALKSPSMRG